MQFHTSIFHPIRLFTVFLMLLVAVDSVQAGEVADLASEEWDARVTGQIPNEELSSEGALATGDFNHDGVQDVLVGTWTANTKNGINSGVAYVFFWQSDLSTLDGASPDLIILGAAANDWLTEFGALTTGDVNGDGIDDILLGAGYADAPDRKNSGAAYVIFGGRAVSGTIDLNADQQDLTIQGAKPALLTGEGALTTGA